jgi:hypothetical protein
MGPLECWLGSFESSDVFLSANFRISDRSHPESSTVWSGVCWRDIITWLRRSLQASDAAKSQGNQANIWRDQFVNAVLASQCPQGSTTEGLEEHKDKNEPADVDRWLPEAADTNEDRSTE